MIRFKEFKAVSVNSVQFDSGAALNESASKHFENISGYWRYIWITDRLKSDKHSYWVFHIILYDL